MLPLYLSIEGLYSYQNKQEIDFSKLTEGGLFGIFGNVGSGKSSILEAISFALYGETERLNKQEKRAYNMMNLKSDNAIIDFRFLNFEGRKFRFIAQWKRKKRFEETTTIERFAYEWKAENWIPLESTDGAAVTNLSYPNFRRTIIIPQGQFKEFLELKGKDRSDMMKEIFFLNQYDLGPKVGMLQADNNKKLENINGALTGFEEVSVEILTSKKEEFELALLNLNLIKDEFEQVEKSYQQLHVARENRKVLAAKQQELQALYAQKAQIQQYEKELAEYESVSQHFKEHINNLHSLTYHKELLLGKIEKLKDAKGQLMIQIDDTDHKLAGIRADYDSLDTFKKEVDDFKLLIHNAELQAKRTELESRIEKGSPIITQTAAREQQLNADLNNEEQQLAKLKDEQVNIAELLAIERWYQINDQYKKQSADIEHKLQTLEMELESHRLKFSEQELSPNNWQQALQHKFTAFDNAKLLWSKKESEVRLKQELSHYISNLKHGDPCPLCGAMEHPQPMHADDVSAELQQLQQEHVQLQQEEDALRTLQQDLANVATRITEKNNQLLNLEADLKAVRSQMEQHDATFVWPVFERENRSAFELQKAAIQEKENLIKNKENTIKSLREQLQLTKDNLVKYERSIDDLKNQRLLIDGSINQNIQQLKVLRTVDHNLNTVQELMQKSTLVQEKIATTQQQFTSWNEANILAKNQLASILGQYTEAHEQYIAMSNQLQQIQGTIKGLLKTFMFDDITQVKSILEKPMDSNGLKKHIQQYHIQVSSIGDRIQELHQLTRDDRYTEQLFEDTIQLYKFKKEEQALQLTLTGALEKELQRLTLELDKKELLLTEFNKLSARKENLRLLDNMFKGNGFVNYVSSIHLARLCEVANLRFHRLTKNQLSLCINDNNEFEVIDYLNNGFKRSVKTLSGGQGFQASLCLALALAESIQSLNKSERNFFFIDEGFGTQDTESINTVFDTLQYLQHENRVVGIISHVEELKERIPRAITVVKDPEKGSFIF
ncbi:AAA family ATPase [Sphingobacterium sp. Mn56C]|uniref:AAA family ATPase n=1 Tax=Sphingobacterium sp. Mn56C TaxID=3395261 RepID=UPI003BBDE8D3